MSHETSFTLPSYRSLCKYLGETDAMVELTELSARFFLGEAKESGQIAEFVKTTSEKYGICVNLAEVAQLSIHLSRGYIVTVYQSAERFLHEYRAEHIELYDKSWTGDGDGVDPLSVALKNIAATSVDALVGVGADLVSRFQYYRSVRNWIVHSKDSDVNKPLARHGEIAAMSHANEALLSGFSMPNRPDRLSFDDFILFSRVAKALAFKMCEIATPKIDDWKNHFANGALGRFKKFHVNSDRMKNSISMELMTKYGMDNSTARWISEELSGSLV